MNELTFTAGVHSIEDHTAVFYVMNTTVNRNRWTVSDRALEQALPTIIGKPLGCGPEYRTDRHYDERLQVGVFADATKPDGYALGTATITDETAWSRLSEGSWGPVSVVVTSYLERCSVCGADLTGSDDPFSHQCIVDGGYLVVESFVFDHVDFVDVPAYPQAGLVGVGSVVPVELLAGVFQLSGRALEPAAGSRESRSETMMETRLTALEASVKGLKDQVDSLEATLAAEPKNKHGAELGGLEFAMAEARLRLFGRAG